MNVSGPLIAAAATVFVAAVGWFIVGVRQAREKRAEHYAEWLSAAINLRQCIKRAGLHAQGSPDHVREMNQWFDLWDRFRRETNLVRLVGSSAVVDAALDVHGAIGALGQTAHEGRATNGPVWQNNAVDDQQLLSWRTASGRSEEALTCAIDIMRADRLGR